MLPNPYILLGALLTAIGFMLGAYFYGRHAETLIFDAYKAQQTAVAEKAAADSANRARAAEDEAAIKQNAIASTYQEQVNALVKTRDSLIAAAGTVHRVYVRVASPGNAIVSKTPSGGPGDNADNSATLDSGSASFFYNEFTAADQLADQLAAAQQVIMQDRMTCNGAAP
jgi:hypothetical protein